MWIKELGLFGYTLLSVSLRLFSLSPCVLKILSFLHPKKKKKNPKWKLWKFDPGFENMGCIDAAKCPPHPRSMRRRVRDVAACALVLRPTLFFFISQLAPTCTDVAQTQADSRQHGVNSNWFTLKRADSHRLRPYWSVSGETADSGQNSKKKKVQNAPFELNNKP